VSRFGRTPFAGQMPSMDLPPKDPKLAAMVSVRAEGSKFLLDADIDQERLRMLVLLGAMFASFPLVHVD